MAIGTSTAELMKVVKTQLQSKFEMSDLGELKQIVGIEISRSKDGKTAFLSQKAYINKIVDKIGLANCNPVTTPLDHNSKLQKRKEDDAPAHSVTEYQAAIGSLMYAAVGTRPDIAFTVRHLSQFSSDPSAAHFAAVKRVFRYLKGTSNYGILLGNISDEPLRGYSDSDWGSNLSDRRSTTGFIFTLGGPITWSSKKQPTVALSSMEAEYMAVSHAAREALWLRTFLAELGHTPGGPTEINVDNQAALAFTHNEDKHTRSKHIDIRHHFIRDQVHAGTISTNYIPTDDNIADLFTKSLPTHRHHLLMERLGMTERWRGVLIWTIVDRTIIM